MENTVFNPKAFDNHKDIKLIADNALENFKDHVDFMKALRDSANFGTSNVGYNFYLNEPPFQGKGVKKNVLYFPIKRLEGNFQLNFTHYQMGSIKFHEDVPYDAVKGLKWYVFREQFGFFAKRFWVQGFAPKFTSEGNPLLPMFTWDIPKLSKLASAATSEFVTTKRVEILSKDWAKVAKQGHSGLRLQYIREIRDNLGLVDYIQPQYLGDDKGLSKSGTLSRQGDLLIQPFFDQEEQDKLAKALGL